MHPVNKEIVEKYIEIKSGARKLHGLGFHKGEMKSKWGFLVQSIRNKKF